MPEKISRKISGKNRNRRDGMASKSIISNDRKCIVCDSTFNLHKHHIFEGTANRKKSEQDGCWCYLCSRHHNGSDAGVHYNKVFETDLKQKTQRLWEQKYGTREDFIKRYGRSYL